MTEEELYNEYRSSDCKSFTDFLINKIAELKEKCQDRCDECWEEHIKLTKAKEIIKNLLVYVPVDLKEYEEAKQFLNKNSTYERIQKAKYNYTD